MIAGYMTISDRQRLPASDGWQTAGIVILLLAVASIPLTIVYATLADRQALKADWAIAGPACPIRAQPARYRRPALAFSYQGVRFTRQYGAASCVVVPDGGIFSRGHHPVCQFTSPAQVSVTVGGRKVIYEPGVGHPATVTVRDGAPSCAVGGWFRY